MLEMGPDYKFPTIGVRVRIVADRTHKNNRHKKMI